MTKKAEIVTVAIFRIAFYGRGETELTDFYICNRFQLISLDLTDLQDLKYNMIISKTGNS